MKRKMLIILYLTIILCYDTSAQMPVRIAHVYERSIDEAFVIRAQKARYTYIVAEFNLSHYRSDFCISTGTYSGKKDPYGNTCKARTTNLRDRLKHLFQYINSFTVDQKGIRLIPEIQTGSRWSEHWARINENVIFIEPNPTQPYVNNTINSFSIEGIAQGGGTKTIILDRNASTAADAYRSFYIGIVGGEGYASPQQWRTITSYNRNGKRIATVDSNWDIVPDTTSRYRIAFRCYTPAFANNPSLDHTFSDVLEVISEAFAEASPNMDYSKLDYIYIGHDEPTTDLQQGIPAPGRCLADAQWIYENIPEHGGIVKKKDASGAPEYYGTPTLQATVALMAHEIETRVNQIRTTPGLEQTRVMIMADAWDPQHNGSLSRLGTSLLLDYPFSAKFKEIIILLPWQYDDLLYGKKYDEKISYTMFSNKGFDFIPIFSIADCLEKTSVITQQRIKRMGKNIHAMQSTSGSGKLLGFKSTAWAYWNARAPHEGYKTIEYASYWTGEARPECSAVRIPVLHTTTDTHLYKKYLFIDQYETIQGDYLAIMQQHPFKNFGDLRLPAENVTWYDAILYCNARSKREHLDTVYTYQSCQKPLSPSFDNNHCVYLHEVAQNVTKNGYRLPTEKEWQSIYKECAYGFYDREKTFSVEYGWCADNADTDNNGIKTTHPVGEKKPDKYNFYDLAGNVAEWLWAESSDSKAPVVGGSYMDFRHADSFKPKIHLLVPKNRKTSYIGFRVLRNAP